MTFVLIISWKFKWGIINFIPLCDLISLLYIYMYVYYRQAAFVRSDPDYLKCKKKECRKSAGGRCLIETCNATLSFHVINFRTDVEFVLFGGGFITPCLYLRSQPLTFQNPNAPLYGLLSAIDSTATSVSSFPNLFYFFIFYFFS